VTLPSDRQEPTERVAVTIPLRTSENTSDEVKRVLTKLEATSNNLAIYRIVANSDTAFRPFVLLSDALLNRGKLPPTIREAVILHLAATRGVAYEWEQHEVIARNVGLSGYIIDELARSEPDPNITGVEIAQAVKIAGHLVEGCMSDREWAWACDAWGPDVAFELVLVVGLWGGLVPILLDAAETRGLRGPATSRRAPTD